MKPRSITHKLLWISAVALIPAVFIAIFTVYRVQTDRVEALHAEAFLAAEWATLELAQIINATDTVLTMANTLPIVKRQDATTCATVMDQIVRDLPFLSAIALVYEDGDAWCKSASVAQDWTFAGTEYFEAARATEGRVIGNSDAGIPPSVRLLPVAKRLDGSAGVVVAFLDLRWLQTQMETRRVDSRDSLAVVDGGGTVIARVPNPEKFVGTRMLPQNLWLLTAPEADTFEIDSINGMRRVLGFFPAHTNESGLYVSAGRNLIDGLAPARSIATASTIIGVLGAILTALLAVYATSILITKPVSKIVDTVTAWRQGNSSARTGMNARDGEICGAGQALDEFMSDLEATRIARRKSEEERELLRDELEHRTKNLIATVQAVARQTFPKAGNEAAMKVYTQRLTAISDANNLLKQAGWKAALLRQIVEASVAPFIGSDAKRLHLSGPELTLQGNVAMALGMALHELSTNAVKYGSLSNDTGSVSIRWLVDHASDGDRFVFIWREVGGPLVVKPERTGFGSKIIKLALAAHVQGSVDLSYEANGVICTVIAPSQNVLSSTEIEAPPEAAESA